MTPNVDIGNQKGQRLSNIVALKKRRLRGVDRRNQFGRVLDDLMVKYGIVKRDGSANQAELGRLIKEKGFLPANPRHAVNNARIIGDQLTFPLVECIIAVLEDQGLREEEADLLLRSAVEVMKWRRLGEQDKNRD